MKTTQALTVYKLAEFESENYQRMSDALFFVMMLLRSQFIFQRSSLRVTRTATT